MSANINPLNLPAVAWLVTDSHGYESLHRDMARAEQQFRHRSGCVLDALVRLSDVIEALDAAAT